MSRASKPLNPYASWSSLFGATVRRLRLGMRAGQPLTPISTRLPPTPVVVRNVQVDTGICPLMVGMIALTGRAICAWPIQTDDHSAVCQTGQLGTDPAANHTAMHCSDVSPPASLTTARWN
jgi:hypothetical protein